MSQYGKKTEYKFFFNKFKYQGYLLGKDEFHLTIFDLVTQKEFLLPIKETTIEVIN